jgi:predicted membrane protein
MEQKKKNLGYINWFNWKLEEKELKNQIENYNTLGFLKSLRKLSFALIIFSIIITLIFIAVGSLQTDAFVDVFIWAILAIFVYRGQKWAIIGAIILWTLEKGFQLYGFVEGGNSSTLLLPILWWAIYMDVFWKTYRVEQERKRQITSAEGYVQENQKIEEVKNHKQFCSTCGKEISQLNNFCKYCGNKIIQ